MDIKNIVQNFIKISEVCKDYLENELELEVISISSYSDCERGYLTVLHKEGHLSFEYNVSLEHHDIIKWKFLNFREESYWNISAGNYYISENYVEINRQDCCNFV